MADKSQECLYNSNMRYGFRGYCDHPKYHSDWGWSSVKCNGCPCPDWTEAGAKEMSEIYLNLLKKLETIYSVKYPEIDEIENNQWNCETCKHSTLQDGYYYCNIQNHIVTRIFKIWGKCNDYQRKNDNYE